MTSCLASAEVADIVVPWTKSTVAVGDQTVGRHLGPATRLCTASLIPKTREQLARTLASIWSTLVRTMVAVNCPRGRRNTMFRCRRREWGRTLEEARASELCVR